MPAIRPKALNLQWAGAENIQTEWLPSTTCVWKQFLVGSEFFDPFYDRFFHWWSKTGRSSAVVFGRVETRNRFYFVRKYKLSLPHCLAAMWIRWVMTILERNWERAWGNWLGAKGRLQQK